MKCPHDATAAEQASYGGMCEDCWTGGLSGVKPYQPTETLPEKRRGKTAVGADKALVEIQRLWGDAPVVDATKDLRVFILPDDAEGAVRRDPGCCVFARACQRSFGSTKVLFFRSVAYVELPDDEGNVRVERFNMTPKMRSLVEAFDRGEGIVPRAGFLLKRPSKAKRLDVERDRNRERMQRQRTMGTPNKSGIGKGKGKYRGQAVAADMTVRNGSGRRPRANTSEGRQP